MRAARRWRGARVGEGDVKADRRDQLCLWCSQGSRNSVSVACRQSVGAMWAGAAAYDWLPRFSRRGCQQLVREIQGRRFSTSRLLPQTACSELATAETNRASGDLSTHVKLQRSLRSSNYITDQRMLIMYHTPHPERPHARMRLESKSSLYLLPPPFPMSVLSYASVEVHASQ